MTSYNYWVAYKKAQLRLAEIYTIASTTTICCESGYDFMLELEERVTDLYSLGVAADRRFQYAHLP